MGNEQSQMHGLELSPKAIEVTDFWSHHSASFDSGGIGDISVFVSEPLVVGTLWSQQTPLEKAAKNLMVHRHPCILKYMSSWTKSSKFYLAVEDVKPLVQELSRQSALQKCIGVHSVLKALVFLHEKAFSSHNNVCISSIYVCREGDWRLGCLEYLTKYSDLKQDYLSKTRGSRYAKAIDPNEDKIASDGKRPDCLDEYAYAVLVQEVFKNHDHDSLPYLNTFLEVCKSELQNADYLGRPKLSSLLHHPFFNHDFISIHSFLLELPLKSDEERSQFFKSVIIKLRQFEEESMASQLGTHLLSRMVLLNETAQQELIPYLLNTKENNPEAIFSLKVFKTYLAPKLLAIFCVRDAQVRLVLLNSLANYVYAFTQDELKQKILPELLVGIKDTNDHLVAVTLRSLADLVPVLGSAVVIGGKRAKLFNDGRPLVQNVAPLQRVTTAEKGDVRSPTVPTLATVLVGNQDYALAERPSPDGEEENSDENESVASELAENEAPADSWDDWDMNTEPSNPISEAMDRLNISASAANAPGHQVTVFKNAIPDITELDIKNQKSKSEVDTDFFEGMEPVIKRNEKFLIEDLMASQNVDFGVKHEEIEGAEWGDEEW